MPRGMIQMGYCLICKEIADDRYMIQVHDRRHDNKVEGNVCGHCFGKFLDSKYNKGSFMIAKIAGWARYSKDNMRVF